MSLDLTLKNREFNFNVTNSSQHKVYEFEEFRLDATTRLLYRAGEQLVLTPKAVETLIALIESQGNVIGKDELMQKIWADTIVEESNLAQYLHVLRKTLGETSDGKPYIETLKRRGYRFNGAVRVVKNGNGLVSVTDDAEDLDLAANEQPKVANLISRRVERLGNVRVFSNLAVDRETERRAFGKYLFGFRLAPRASRRYIAAGYYLYSFEMVFTSGPRGFGSGICGDRVRYLQICDERLERRGTKHSFSRIRHDTAHDNRQIEKGSRDLAGREVCCSHYLWA
jgi:DNA-binding winged helix-turn-helix (wHTH) protein